MLSSSSHSIHCARSQPPPNPPRLSPIHLLQLFTRTSTKPVSERLVAGSLLYVPSSTLLHSSCTCVSCAPPASYPAAEVLLLQGSFVDPQVLRAQPVWATFVQPPAPYHSLKRSKSFTLERPNSRFEKLVSESLSSSAAGYWFPPSLGTVVTLARSHVNWILTF